MVKDTARLFFTIPNTKMLTEKTIPPKECDKNHFDGLHKWRTRHLVEVNAKREVCIFCGLKKI